VFSPVYTTGWAKCDKEFNMAAIIR